MTHPRQTMTPREQLERVRDVILKNDRAGVVLWAQGPRHVVRHSTITVGLFDCLGALLIGERQRIRIVIRQGREDT